jgi:hypothetical protein
MSKKTFKRHYRKHRRSCKRTYKKHYRKNRRDNGTEKGIQIFTKPKKMHSPHILVHQNDFQSGNMIPGLRKKM